MVKRGTYCSAGGGGGVVAGQTTIEWSARIFMFLFFDASALSGFFSQTLHVSGQLKAEESTGGKKRKRDG